MSPTTLARRSHRRVVALATRLLPPLLLSLLARFLLLPRIAQLLLNASQLRLAALTLSDPQAVSARVSLDVVLERTGPFATLISFHAPARVLYKGVHIANAVLSNAISVPANGGKVSMHTDMHIINIKLFAAFTADLVQSRGPVHFVLHAVGIEVALFGGLLRVPGLRLIKEVELPGMAGLQGMRITSMQVTDATSNSLVLVAKCKVFNPSSVTLSIGRTQLVLALPNATHSLALITVHDMILRPGDNELLAHCEMPQPVPSMNIYPDLMTVLGNYLNGITMEVFITGHPTDATPYQYLLQALTTLHILTIMPSLSISLLHRAAISLMQLNPLTRIIPSYITVTNPFPLPMTIMHMTGSTTTSTTPALIMGMLDTSTPIYIPADSIVLCETGVPLKLSLGLSQLLEVTRSRGELLVDIECTIDCRLGDCYLGGIQYRQQKVPVSIQL